MKEKTSFLKKPGVQTLLASVLCAVLGIVIGFIILLFINPAHAFDAIIAILKNFFRFSNSPQLMMYYFGSTVVKAVPLILCALAILFAYKAGLFNIGAAGQYTVGFCAALFCALALKLPWYLCTFAAVVVGAFWGAIAGAFKAFFNVNEVIAGIMVNWIGLYLTNIILSDSRVMNPSLSETYGLESTAPQALLPNLGMDKVFADNKYATIAIPVTILIAVAIWIILNKTTFGYELKATGHNKEAAKYAGMNAKKNIILTMTISGGLAGLAAAFYYLTGIENYTLASSVPGMGFSGIAVAFLGGLHPLGALAAGFFVEHVTLGGQYVDTTYYNPQVADLMIAVIIYLCGFVLFFKSIMNRRKKTAAPVSGEEMKKAADSAEKVSENKEKEDEK